MAAEAKTNSKVLPRVTEAEGPVWWDDTLTQQWPRSKPRARHGPQCSTQSTWCGAVALVNVPLWLEYTLTPFLNFVEYAFTPF